VSPDFNDLAVARLQIFCTLFNLLIIIMSSLLEDPAPPVEVTTDQARISRYTPIKLNLNN
jgi:hypothetical protein